MSQYTLLAAFVDITYLKIKNGIASYNKQMLGPWFGNVCDSLYLNVSNTCPGSAAWPST